MTDQIDGNKNSQKVILRSTFLARFFLLLAILVVAVAAFLYFNLYFLFPGSGPAGTEIPAKPFEQVWTHRKVLLLGIGDSITDGFGAPRGFSYFQRLIQNPQGDSEDMLDKNLSKVIPNLLAENIAVSFTVSRQHLEKIEKFPQQDANTFGIVVMTTGGNDLIHDYGRSLPKECAMYGATFEEAEPWITNFQHRLDTMISRISEKFPAGCQIFIANIYDPSDGTGKTLNWLTGLPAWKDGLMILDAYNKIIADCAAKYENVHLVNIHDPFLGHGLNCKKFWIKHYRFSSPHYWYHINVEDPNIRGYDVIRRLFLLEMIKVFFDSSVLKM